MGLPEDEYAPLPRQAEPQGKRRKRHDEKASAPMSAAGRNGGLEGCDPKKSAEAAAALDQGAGAASVCEAMLLERNRVFCVTILNHQNKTCARPKAQSVRQACFANIPRVMARVANRNAECGCERACHEAFARELQEAVNSLR